MKRSRVQLLPSQKAIANSKKSRYDLEDVEEKPLPSTNIFLVETALRRLFKQIKSVSMLKDLRNICQLWDKLITEELEERAFQGQFKPINLTFYDEDSDIFKSSKVGRSEMRGFLRDTRENPKLFRSFALIFPASLTFLHMDEFKHFYTGYSPTFLKFIIPSNFRFNKQKDLLLKELLRWAAPTLRELFIPNNIIQDIKTHIPTERSQSEVLKFPHLQKVSTEQFYYDERSSPIEAFKVIFTKGNRPETPALTFLKTRAPDLIDFLGLNLNPSRWTTLTKLEFGYSNENNDAALHKATTGLLALGQAGVTLKKLTLGLRFWKYNAEEDRDAPQFISSCRNLTQFFTSQATSLEALKLTIEFNFDVSIGEEEGEERKKEVKIILPIFKSLNRLSLDLDCCVYINESLTYNIFQFESIAHNFPALEDLTLEKFHPILKVLFGDPLKTGEEPSLKRFKLTKVLAPWDRENQHFFDHLGSVENFACPQEFFQKDLNLIKHLMSTIRVLHIHNVTSRLDLSQFKGLKRVVIEEDDSNPEEHDDVPRAQRKRKKMIQHKGRYLGYFKEVAKLGLDSIMFRGLDIFGEQNKELFVKSFPFRVEFEEKPVKWVNEDFMDN